MVIQKVLTILKKNPQFKEFLNQIENFEIFYKNLSIDEIKRLKLEFPDLLKSEIQEQMFNGHKSNNLEIQRSIYCLTLVRKDKNENNYIKLKKIKFYIDVFNQKIIKIFQN
jgi:hypothetical protein